MDCVSDIRVPSKSAPTPYTADAWSAQLNLEVWMVYLSEYARSNVQAERAE